MIHRQVKEMQFDPNLPIYMQIISLYKRQIASGVLPPGFRIAPVREQAVTLGVNPNTLQRAMTELEREGLVYVERTAGRYITQDLALIENVRVELSGQIIAQFVSGMNDIGMRTEDIPTLLIQHLERNKAK